ncbi:MAG: trypsin-like peptidase domain-containing protein [Alphaproteobacteria bacterium]|nr:trypsin-like peptidase domain-containing protein [Alphaproteobacteria bacterium]
MVSFRILRPMMLALLVLTLALPAQGKSPCHAPDAVCAAASRVFRIASFDPLASAVLIETGLLVTNRHVIAENREAVVFLPSGEHVTATVVPTAYKGDLILIHAPDIKAKNPFQTAQANPKTRLYTIGADIRSRTVRVYKPGRLLAPLAEGKPLARLHNDAFSQPGNSGGALVDSKGRLIGVVTSGGEGRNETIPAAEIKKLRTRSGPEHETASRALGLAYRKCIESLEAVPASRKRLPPGPAAVLKDQCGRTNNRQLWDLAGQTFGRQGYTEDAIEMFSRALNQDPSAINSMVSMAVALHLSGRYADEAVLLRRLIDILPSDPGVLRLGVQAGAWGNDKALLEKSLKLMEKHFPSVAPTARAFIEKNPTPPKRRKRQ